MSSGGDCARSRGLLCCRGRPPTKPEPARRCVRRSQELSDMDDRRFDALVRAIGQSGSRRTLIKGALGLGGLAAFGGMARHDLAEAARRPTPTPRPVSCPGQQVPCETGCCCPDGLSKCGGACCPDGAAECCDGACCYGECYGEELCCPTGSAICPDGICCDGRCMDDGTCCPGLRACDGRACCPEDMHCCRPRPGAFLCIPDDMCCNDSECPGTRCIEGFCQ
jgi:hypothetical protein